MFLPFCHNSRVRQTDRQTDSFLIAIMRLHSMQRGKNVIAIEAYIRMYRTLTCRRRVSNVLLEQRWLGGSTRCLFF